MSSRFPPPRARKTKKKKTAQASNSMAPPPSRAAAVRSKPTATIDIFEDPMMAQFYEIFSSYANDILSLMRERTHHETKLDLDAYEDDDVPVEDRKSKQEIFTQYWRQFLKHIRKWDRKTLDQEVVRILKSMAGLVADIQSDSDSEDSDDEGGEEPEGYRDVLNTYLEYARWIFMGSLTDSDAEPVDDIPVVDLSDFVCYFTDAMTRQRSVKNCTNPKPGVVLNTFLEYNEVNQAAVIKPCIVAALRRTIPKNVYRALLKVRLDNSRSRFRSRGSSTSMASSAPLVHVKTQFSRDMMSSRAVASRMNTDQIQNTMASSATPRSTTPESSKPASSAASEEEAKSPAAEEQASSATPKEQDQGLSTALAATTDALSGGADVRRVDLDSLGTSDYQTGASDYTAATTTAIRENVTHAPNHHDMGTSVPVFRESTN